MKIISTKIHGIVVGFAGHVWVPHLAIAVLRTTVVLLTYPEEKAFRVTP